MAMTSFQLLSGIAAGAGIMYLLDPDRGRRRRSLARDQFAHARHKAGEAFGATVSDVRNRTYGTFAQLKSGLSADSPVPDAKLQARVRSELGRVVSHPRAIEVTARDGCVTLAGPILDFEKRRVTRRVARIPGVIELRDELEAHREDEAVSALQGGVRREARIDIRQKNWSPATRLFSSIVGMLLGTYGTRHGGLLGATMSVLGFGMLARAAANKDFAQLAEEGAKLLQSNPQGKLEPASETDLLPERWEEAVPYAEPLLDPTPTPS